MNAEMDPKYVFSLKIDPEQCTSLTATLVFLRILLSIMEISPEKKIQRKDFKNHYSIINYSSIFSYFDKILKVY